MKAAAIAGLVLAPLLGGCGFDVMYADWKVNRLCKVDGGVTVFAQEALPEYLRRENGEIDLRALARTTDRDPIYLVSTDTTIEPRDPTILRFEYRMMRKRDGAVLGKYVMYLRPNQNTGIPLMHRNAYFCPSAKAVGTLATAVFGKPNE